MTNDDSCSEQRSTCTHEVMRALSRWTTIVALLVAMMLNVQWIFSSTKSLALHPSSTVTARVPDPDKALFSQQLAEYKAWCSNLIQLDRPGCAHSLCT